jgi:DNA-directed RNA polymerase specialized sigma24 family protein
MTEWEFKAFIERNAASFDNFARVMARRNESVAFDDLLDARSGALLSVWLKFRKEPVSKDVEAHMKYYTLRCIKTNALKRYRDTRNETPYDSTSFESEDTSPSITGLSMEERLDDELAKLPPKIEAAVRELAPIS